MKLTMMVLVKRTEEVIAVRGTRIVPLPRASPIKASRIETLTLEVEGIQQRKVDELVEHIKPGSVLMINGLPVKVEKLMGTSILDDGEEYNPVRPSHLDPFRRW